MRLKLAAGGLAGILMAAAVVVAAIVALMVVVAAAVAYLKRDSWTVPAYRQARDRTGQWSMTPWSSHEPGQPQEETEAPADAPAEASETTS